MYLISESLVEVRNYWRSMVLAIEPMVNAGTYKVKTLKDGWTVVTADTSLSAHYENTVAILSDGLEILTLIK